MPSELSIGDPRKQLWRGAHQAAGIQHRARARNPGLGALEEFGASATRMRLLVAGMDGSVELVLARTELLRWARAAPAWITPRRRRPEPRTSEEPGAWCPGGVGGGRSLGGTWIRHPKTEPANP
jgi:hypothetical protein